VTSNSREHCSRMQQSHSHALIENWMIPFAAYSAVDSPNIFQWAVQPQKLAIPVRVRDLHLIMVFSGSRESALNGISIVSAVFVHLTRMFNTYTHRQTDRQTDRPRCMRQATLFYAIYGPKMKQTVHTYGRCSMSTLVP